MHTFEGTSIYEVGRRAGVSVRSAQLRGIVLETQAFRLGAPCLGRLSCALLVATGGNSIAVNVVRVLRDASIARRV